MIIEAIQYFKEADGNLGANSPMKFLENKHQLLCLDEQKSFNISLYKTLLFIYMVDALKSGKLNVKYSYRYRAIQDYLISQERWEREKDQLLALEGLSHSANIDMVLLSLSLRQRILLAQALRHDLKVLIIKLCMDLRRNKRMLKKVIKCYRVAPLIKP